MLLERKREGLLTRRQLLRVAQGLAEDIRITQERNRRARQAHRRRRLRELHRLGIRLTEIVSCVHQVAL